MKDIIEQYEEARNKQYEISPKVIDAIKQKIYNRLLEIKGPDFHEDDEIKCCHLGVFLGYSRSCNNDQEQETDFFSTIEYSKYGFVSLCAPWYLTDEFKAWSDDDYRCHIKDDYKILHIETADGMLCLDKRLEQIGFYNSDFYESYSYTP